MNTDYVIRLMMCGYTRTEAILIADDYEEDEQDLLLNRIESMEEEGSYRNSYDGESYRGGSYRRSYNMGGSYDDNGSYRRGRGRNARRDSRGRYSSEGGYSRASEDMVDQLQEMMEMAPDQQTRQDIQRLMKKMEQQ